jgi:hypothetical protein
MGCGDDCGFWGDANHYNYMIALVLIPTTLMKEIAELHIVSMSLFGAALLFVVINIFQIFLRDHHNVTNIDLSYASYWWPTTASTDQIISVISAIAVV